MRRFILTYQEHEGLRDCMELEGIEFSNGNVALEYYPDGSDWPGARGFTSLKSMEYKLNEFGDTSIKWLDEVQP